MSYSPNRAVRLSYAKFRLGIADVRLALGSLALCLVASALRSSRVTSLLRYAAVRAPTVERLLRESFGFAVRSATVVVN